MSSSLIGHHRQIDYINKTRTYGRLPHAYLFYGPSHIGKLTFALTFAQSFFCPQIKDNDLRSVCGVCSICRAIKEFHYPHVIVLDTNHTLTSQKDSRKEIPIGDIRELKRIWSYAPQGTTMRLAIINEADKMSEEAANACLKLFEEPGAHTLIILIASSRDVLPFTIVSRVQSIHFSPLTKTEMKTLLQAVSNTSHQKDEEELLAIAGGRPGILVQLCNDDSYASQERLCLRDVQSVIENHDMVLAMRLSEEASQDMAMRERIVFHVMAHLRRVLIKPQGERFDYRIARTMSRVDRIAELLDSTNVNPRLAFDALFLECIHKGFNTL